MLALLLAVALLGIAAVVDLRRRTIPDGIPLALLCAGVLFAACRWDATPWTHRAIGLVAGLLLGAALFYAGLLGGGDAKAIAGVGALVGLPTLVVVLVFASIAGGGFAWAARRRGERELAYAPALAIGAGLAWVLLRIEGAS